MRYSVFFFFLMGINVLIRAVSEVILKSYHAITNTTVV